MSNRKSPFKFLDSYAKDDYALYFGRENEIKSLFEVLQGVKLLLLYGLSGTGKTSLIECGLRNQFTDADWLAISIRRGENILNSTHQTIKDELAKGDSNASENYSAQNLSEAVDKLYHRFYKPIYILFDQFEELLILGNKEEQENFFKELFQLVCQRIPCKVIIIIREEYLGNLHEFEPFCPNIFQSRFRLKKMERKLLPEVMLAMLKKLDTDQRLKLLNSSELANRIMKILPEDSQEVELTLIQVFLNELWERAEMVTPPGTVPELNPNLVRDDDQLLTIMKSFLNDVLEKLDAEFGIGSSLELLASMCTEKGTKVQMSEPELQKELDQKNIFLEQSISNLLTELGKFQVIRSLKVGDQVKYEISHDSLAQAIGENISDEMRTKDVARKEYDRFERRPPETVLEPHELQLIQALKHYQPYSDKLEIQVKKSNEYWKHKNRIKYIYALLLIITASLFAFWSGIRKGENSQASYELEKDAQAIKTAILVVDYEKAKTILKRALDTKKIDTKQKLLEPILELIFWFTTANKTTEANELIAWLGEYSQDLIQNRTTDSTLHIDEISASDGMKETRRNVYDQIFAIDPSLFKRLEKKYFPEMILVEGGQFKMGCNTPTKKFFKDCGAAEDQHDAEVSDFYISRYETTVWQWNLFRSAIGKNDIHHYLLRDTVPKDSSKVMRVRKRFLPLGGNYPISKVTWIESVQYCNWLSAQKDLDSIIIYKKGLYQLKDTRRGSDIDPAKRDSFLEGYRLPMEAEWEYAARNQGEWTYLFSNGKDQARKDELNFDCSKEQNPKKSYVVFGKPRNNAVVVDSLNSDANPLGIQHMSGNVWEWCFDGYGPYPLNLIKNYIGFSKINKVLRGGSWKEGAGKIRVVERETLDGRYTKDDYGFRVARWTGKGIK